MSRTYYLVDNNALISLTRRRVQTEFFPSRCRTTEDVLHEASEHRDWRLLATLVEPTTPAILEQVRVVMADVKVGETGLIDLYANKGAADPGLVATVLAHAAAQDEYLFPDEWIIVTHDQAVLDTAARHDIPTLAPSDLADLIDAAPGSSPEAASDSTNTMEQQPG